MICSLDLPPRSDAFIFSTAARLENGKRVENSAAAKLFDLAVDYKSALSSFFLLIGVSRM